MKLFKNHPVTPINIIQNKNYILQLGRVPSPKVPKQLVYTVFSGVLRYSPEKNAYYLTSDNNYIAWYRNISKVPESLLETNIEPHTMIGITNKVREGIYEKEYLEFWLEKDGVRLDAVIFLNEKDKEVQIIKEEIKEEDELILIKPIKMKGETKEYNVVEREGELYINLKDLETMLNVDKNEDGIITLTSYRKKKEKKDENNS